jgi:hypothetical protein
MDDGAFALNGLPDMRHLDDDSLAWDGFRSWQTGVSQA